MLDKKTNIIILIIMAIIMIALIGTGNTYLGLLGVILFIAVGLYLGY